MNHKFIGDDLTMSDHPAHMQVRNLADDLQGVKTARLVHRHRVFINPIHSGVTNIYDISHIFFSLSPSPSPSLPASFPCFLAYEPFFYEYPTHLSFLGTYCKEYTKSQVLFHIAVLEVLLISHSHNIFSSVSLCTASISLNM